MTEGAYTKLLCWESKRLKRKPLSLCNDLLETTFFKKSKFCGILSDRLSHLSRQKKLKAIFHQKQTFDVSSNFNGVIRWHTSSGFKDAYKWHLNLSFALKQNRKKMQLKCIAYSRIRVKKLRHSSKKL